MKSSNWVTVLIVAGCASEPPPVNELADTEYRRESSRIEAIEAFEELERRCALAGGSVQVRRHSSGHMSLSVDELRTATCQ